MRCFDVLDTITSLNSMKRNFEIPSKRPSSLGFHPPLNVAACLVDVSRACWQYPSQYYFCPYRCRWEGPVQLLYVLGTFSSAGLWSCQQGVPSWGPCDILVNIVCILEALVVNTICDWLSNDCTDKQRHLKDHSSWLPLWIPWSPKFNTGNARFLEKFGKP